MDRIVKGQKSMETRKTACGPLFNLKHLRSLLFAVVLEQLMLRTCNV